MFWGVIEKVSITLNFMLCCYIIWRICIFVTICVLCFLVSLAISLPSSVSFLPSRQLHSFHLCPPIYPQLNLVPNYPPHSIKSPGLFIKFVRSSPSLISSTRVLVLHAKSGLCIYLFVCSSVFCLICFVVWCSGSAAFFVRVFWINLRLCLKPWQF